MKMYHTLHPQYTEHVQKSNRSQNAAEKKSAASCHKPTTNRRKMTDVEKGMILAFFYVFQKILVVAILVGHPWSTF